MEKASYGDTGVTEVPNERRTEMGEEQKAQLEADLNDLVKIAQRVLRARWRPEELPRDDTALLAGMIQALAVMRAARQ
jgi:hypothetical protein